MISISRFAALTIGILALLVLIGGLALWENVYDARSEGAIARRIAVACEKLSGEPSDCYEREVPPLYPEFDVATLFGIIREIRAIDPSYQFCHVLAHKLGERVVAEDPARWTDAIALNPSDGLCSNGFIHGVIGGRFRAEVLDASTTEKLIPDFARACSPREGWSPSDLDRAICYHGIGHLYVFITNADIRRALTICEQTVPDDFRRVCIEGVFMQIYQPLEPDDFLLIEQMTVKPTRETVRSFCASFGDSEYVGACLRESWPFFAREIRRGTGIAAFCSGQPDARLEDLCYRSAFTIVGRLALGDQDRAVGACDNSPPERLEMCYSVLAQSVFEEDRGNAGGALALCERASPQVAAACVDWLISQAPFIFGSDTKERTQFCRALPSHKRQECFDIGARLSTDGA